MFNGLDPLAVALLGFAVIAGVEFVKRIYVKDYEAAITIVVAVIIGGFAAPYAGSITHFQGVLIGLQAAGVITTATKI